MSKLILEDKTFGEIKFEFDTLKNELTCKNFNIPFGEYNPTIKINDYKNDCQEFYLRSLEFLYKNEKK